MDDIWPGCVALSDFFCDHPVLVKGKSVLELGAGAALPSLVSSALKAEKVVITDYPADNVIENIDYLIEVNGLDRNKVSCMGHVWGKEDSFGEIISENNGRKFDVLILAELIWKDTYQFHDQLLQSVSATLCTENGVAFISFCHRPCETHTIENDLELFQRAERDFGLQSIKLCEIGGVDNLSGGHDEVVVNLYAMSFRSSLLSPLRFCREDNKTVDEVVLSLVQNKYVFIPARDMRSHIGIDDLNGEEAEAEIKLFMRFWDDCAPQIDEKGNEVYPFKTSLVSHYCPIPDIRDGGSAEAFERISGVRTSIEHIDPTTEQDPTVSYYRLHKAWNMQSADCNTILSNIKRFLMWKVLPKVLQTEDPGGSIYDYAAMQTAYRVTHDPGPEGVHQDSAVLTAVMLVKRMNCDQRSAVNRIWSLEQSCGKPTIEDLSSARLLYETTMLDLFDTILLLDRRVKHEVTRLEKEIASEETLQRDVLTFEIRKRQHVSVSSDNDVGSW